MDAALLCLICFSWLIQGAAMPDRVARNQLPPCDPDFYYETTIGMCRHCERACDLYSPRHDCDQYCTKFGEHSTTSEIPVPENEREPGDMNIIVAGCIVGAVLFFIIIIIILIVCLCTRKGKGSTNTTDAERGATAVTSGDADDIDHSNGPARSRSAETRQGDNVPADQPEDQHLLPEAPYKIPAPSVGPSVQQPTSSAVQHAGTPQGKHPKRSSSRQMRRPQTNCGGADGTNCSNQHSRSRSDGPRQGDNVATTQPEQQCLLPEEASNILAQPAGPPVQQPTTSADQNDKKNPEKDEEPSRGAIDQHLSVTRRTTGDGKVCGTMDSTRVLHTD